MPTPHSRLRRLAQGQPPETDDPERCTDHVYLDQIILEINPTAPRSSDADCEVALNPWVGYQCSGKSPLYDFKK